MATMHAPQLLTRPPEEDTKQLDTGVAALRRLGKLLDESKPDALIIFASDHLETFFMKSVPTFAIMSCENATAAFAGRSWNPPIHQRLAEAVLEQLVARDFDMAYSQEADLGHSFAAIFEWVLENRAIPVVPIFINTYLPAPQCPSLCRAWQGHRRDRGSPAPNEWPCSRAAECRTVLAPGSIASLPMISSLVHPRTGKQPQRFVYQSQRRATRRSRKHRDAALGRGARSCRTPAHRALSYQETTHHGHAVAIFHPGEKPNADPPRPYTFHNHPYHFYNHPPLAAPSCSTTCDSNPLCDYVLSKMSGRLPWNMA